MRALTVSAMLLASCLVGPSCEFETGAAKSEPETGREKRAVLVRVARPERGTLGDRLEITARVEAFRRAAIHPRVEGVVTAVLKGEGDVVARDEVLAEIENDRQELELQSARLAVDQAGLGVNQAKLALEEARTRQAGEKVTLENESRKLARARDQHEQKIIADQDLEAAEYAHATALAQYEQSRVATAKLEEDVRSRELAEKEARARLDQSALQLEWTRIRATVAGTVTRRFVREGQRATPAETLFEIDDLASLVVEPSLPEREMRRLAPGLPVRLSTTAYADARFTGRVEMVSPKIDTEGGKVRVRIRLDPSDPPLLPGMFVSGHIVTEERRGILLLPKKALLFDRDRPYVYVLDRSAEGPPRVRKVGVVRGLEDALRVQYLPAAGREPEIDEDDEVVVVGLDRLFDGAEVEFETEDAVPSGAGAEARNE